jgi:hypothetical protein
MQRKLFGITSVNFDVIDQMLIRYSIFVRYWRESWRKMGQYISYLYIVRRPMTE